MTDVPSLDLDFSQSPTVWKLINDDSFVRGLMGPVGSGKSYGCAAEIMLRAVKQRPSPRDGIRYTRFVVVRNTYPELRTTTIKTWQELFPESTWGGMRWQPPITHHIKLPARGDAAGIDCEVIFLALDTPQSVRKLLSLEITGAWCNEARELPKAVIDGLTHRVGRYPTKADGGPSWYGIWMDTNPPDSDHWWHDVSEKNPIKGKWGWNFHRQPGGVIQALPEEVPENPEANDFVHGAGRWWRINPAAENRNNLPPGYYPQLIGGKNLDWIRCYAEGKFTFVQEGRPVWPEYDDELMSGDVELDPYYPVQIGVDFGLTPAAIFGQRTQAGGWRILDELVTFDMGLERFGQEMLARIAERYNKQEILIWGDPAGNKRDEIYEVTAFDHLRSLGFKAQPTESNAFQVRREAGAAPMSRLISSKPGLIVDKKCLRLRKSLSGGYFFKRQSLGAGQERFRDTPVKNEHSHCGDAFGYLMLGGGEQRRLRRGHYSPPGSGVYQANMDFDVL
ncbi:TerL [Alphaproteobacteria bacterium]|nr:TerL [Alphaproteobacteria bacterium]